MKAFYSDTFVLPLPDHHRFPMAKYRLLRERLVAEGILTAADLEIPESISWDDVRLVHDAGYVDAVGAGTLSAEAQRRIGFPWSPMMVERSRRSVGRDAGGGAPVLRCGSAGPTTTLERKGFSRASLRTSPAAPTTPSAIAARATASSTMSRSLPPCCCATAPSHAPRWSIAMSIRATAPRQFSATSRRCSRSRCTARTTSRSGRKPAISTSRSTTAPATTNTWRRWHGICRACSTVIGRTSCFTWRAPIRTKAIGSADSS